MDDEIIPGKYTITLREDADPLATDSHVKWITNVHARSLSRRDTGGGFRTRSGRIISRDTLATLTKQRWRKFYGVKMYVSTNVFACAFADHSYRWLLLSPSLS